MKLSKEMLFDSSNSRQQTTATHSHTADLSSAGNASTATPKL
jgi:hypothetical protein